MQEIQNISPEVAPKKKKLWLIIFVLLFAGACSALFVYYKMQNKEYRPNYSQIYRLVNEKVSKSASIAIHLPSVMNKAEAIKAVKFEPNIEGSWVDVNNEKDIVFTPKNKLDIGHYYNVTLALADGEIKADFLASEDPEITAIFPKEGAEALENSEITIAFNRPMVPLSVLGYAENLKQIPVEITPKTEGKFKWISTNTLQFIPKDHLISSSNYHVKINSGFVSMDGLEVKGAEKNFITNKLRYYTVTSGNAIYNQPISVYFNQPVDINKIRKEIILKNETTGQNTPFTIEYKSKAKVAEEDTKELGVKDKVGQFLGSLFNLNIFKSNKSEKLDESVIEIYPNSDKFGRKKFWDFGNTYNLTINKSYPSAGDIALDTPINSQIQVSEAVASVNAESSRTNYANADFFDPQGRLVVSFYEDIELSKSRITALKIKQTGYLEKCKDKNMDIKSNPGCDKETDKKKIFIAFDDSFSRGEKFDLSFDRIVNTSGLLINRESIRKGIAVYPDFTISKTNPINGNQNADLTKITICSSTPILAPTPADFKKYISANNDFEVLRWPASYRVEKDEICQLNEFRTTIGYGLMPTSDYSLNFKFQDVFSQSKDFAINLKTGEMPSVAVHLYPLQNDTNTTTPSKTKLTFAAQNMEYANLEICKLPAFNYLSLLTNRPQYYDPIISGCEKVAKDQIQLPKKFWVKNYFQVDIKKYFPDGIGSYVLTLTHPQLQASYWSTADRKYIYRQEYQRTFVSITNLSVTEKRIELSSSTWEGQEPITADQSKDLKSLYWVTDLTNLNGVAGASAKVYKQSNDGKVLTLAGEYMTGNDGIAQASAVSSFGGAIITKGNDSAVIGNYSDQLDWASDAVNSKVMYIYTDKPIYRPGAEVDFKGMYRLGYDGNYQIFSDKPINVKVYNSKNDEILNKDIGLNDFGTFNDKVILSATAPLGNYRICGDQFGCAYFDVEEYVPSAFEVNVKTDKEEYISKDNVNIDVSANYYFGVPVEAGDVEYTFSSQNYYFDRYTNGYFKFGADWYYTPPFYYGDKFIARGTVKLNADGTAKISENLDLSKIFPNKEERTSKIIVLDVTVKNNSGQSVSSQKSFMLHAGEFYIGLNSDKSFVAKNEKTNIKVKTTDIKGKEMRVNNIDLNIYKTDWIYNKRQEATGGYSYKWEKKRDFVKKYSFNTDNSGNYTQEISLDKEGEYEVEADSNDSKGNEVFSIYNLYVYGDGSVNVKPTNDNSLDITAEKTKLNVGEDGKLIIKSPYPKAKALITIERGKVYEYQIKDISGNLFNYNFNVKENYSPNVYVSVTLVSDKPEVKYGDVAFDINTNRRELNISVKPDKGFYLPGEEVTLDVVSKDYTGNGVPAEVSLSVVDLSVLALKGNPKQNPMLFFYGGFPLSVSTSSNLKQILQEVEIKTKGGGGGENMAMPSAAKDMLATKKRGEFKETAYWQANVKTDNSGKAKITFKLPDNLTRWQAEMVGITKDTKVGAGYAELTTKKELMAVPLKPRFAIPGDNFYIGAQIFNQSSGDKNISVNYSSSNLPLKNEKADKKIKVKAGETQTVYFQTQVPQDYRDDSALFVISAKGDGLEDTVEQTITINQNSTYEATATSNYTSNEVSKEYIFLPDNVVSDRGGLTVKASGTLAVFLSDALNYMMQYPYGCAEQIASQLKTIAVIRRGVSLPNIADKFEMKKIKYQDKEYTPKEIVDIGLGELYNNQSYDGGFSYFKGNNSNYYLTLDVIDSFGALKSGGYSVNQSVIDNATKYIIQEINTKSELNTDYDTIVNTAYTLYNLPGYDANNLGVITNKINQIAGDVGYINDKASNDSLASLAIILSKSGSGLTGKISDTLDNRINIDSRGAFLSVNNNYCWWNYETAIKDTALYLKLQAYRKKDNQINDKVVRWILNSKEKDGAWGSTNNTLSVIDAFTDYLLWKRETESNFDVDLLVNNNKEANFNVNATTILNQFEKDWPIAKFPFNKTSVISFIKKNNNTLPNNLYYDMSLKYYLPTDQLAPRDEGFAITRNFYKKDDVLNKTPVLKAKVGEVLKEHIVITVPKTRKFVSIEDYIPAGMEAINLDLATEQKSLNVIKNPVSVAEIMTSDSELLSRDIYPDFKEIRDDRVFVYKETLDAGVYEFDYYVRPLIKGKFNYLPAVVSEMYFPENFGRTDGRIFEIE